VAGLAPDKRPLERNPASPYYGYIIGLDLSSALGGSYKSPDMALNGSYYYTMGLGEVNSPSTI
jgi:hypothetical protein